MVLPVSEASVPRRRRAGFRWPGEVGEKVRSLRLRGKAPIRVFILIATAAVILGTIYVVHVRTSLPYFPIRTGANIGADTGRRTVTVTAVGGVNTQTNNAEADVTRLKREFQSNTDSGSNSGSAATATTTTGEVPKWIEMAPSRTGDAPEWCDRLRANPLPDDSHCRHDISVKCVDGKPRFFSQLNQDRFLFERHFKFLKRRGVYLDIAANEAIGLSNTFFFDECLRWEGICIEPNPRYHNDLRKKRSCSLVTSCVGNTTEEVEFMMMEGLSGVTSTNKNSAASLSRGHTTRMTCRPTREALRHFPTAKHIDYMSLDVEGHELQVLQGIDWDTTTIDIISIEPSSLPALVFLENMGYTKLDSGLYWFTSNPIIVDFIYVRKGVVFGKPV